MAELARSVTEFFVSCTTSRPTFVTALKRSSTKPEVPSSPFTGVQVFGNCGAIVTRSLRLMSS